MNSVVQPKGLTHDGQRLIMSDGTSALHFLDPVTFHSIGRIEVSDSGRPVRDLNELEYVKDEIPANVWQSNRIARISPQTGRVVGWIELTSLIDSMAPPPTDVLNGIAYDPVGDRVFVSSSRLSATLLQVLSLVCQYLERISGVALERYQQIVR
ncbi:MAG: glutaminyl-peptide cyclotransferase [Acidobacteria bacterium]|nr:glutaminyl-peptide cyclotransferase [Acidobacteriota bacterium]